MSEINEYDLSDFNEENKIELLKLLYNNTQFVGFLKSFFLMIEMKKKENIDLTNEELEIIKTNTFSYEKANEIFKENKLIYIDYFCGKPIKIDFRNIIINPSLYDRDAGKNKCLECIRIIRMY